jgi:multimeric flavodoxin WrbA
MLDPRQEALCSEITTDYSDLRALFLNCTLKPSPATSHTGGLFTRSKAIMERLHVAVDVVRVVDWDLPPGVYPDMREHGVATDAWPELYDRVLAADIVIIGTPIWLGEKSSVCSRVIERLYGSSAELNESGQYAYYGRVGGCVVTGNEDGAKHCAMNIPSTPCSTWASPSRPKPTPPGWARSAPGLPTSTRDQADRPTTSRTGTSPS